MDPLTYLSLGSLGTGLIGGLAGLFKDNPEVEVPTMDLLRENNPALFDELQRLRSLSSEYDRLYAQRQRGATTNERLEMDDARRSNSAMLANRNLIGSSAGQQLQADFDNRMQAALAQRVAQDQERLMAQRQQSQLAYLQAQQAALQPYSQAQAANAQAQAAENASQNQFFSGLFNSGLGLLGTQYFMGQDPFASRGGSNLGGSNVYGSRGPGNYMVR